MINFAIIGCGNMAKWHAEELGKLPDVKVVALVDPIPARTAEIRKRFWQKAKEFTSIEASWPTNGSSSTQSTSLHRTPSIFRTRRWRWITDCTCWLKSRW